MDDEYYYVPVMPEGHDLGSSRRNPGARSGNSFDSEGHLGRPDWVPVRRQDADGEPENRNVVVQVVLGMAAGVVLTVAAIKSAPHIKRRWNDFQHRRSADTAVIQSRVDETLTTSQKVFVNTVDVVISEQTTTMSSAEAQERLLSVVLAAAFIADQMRALATARLEDAEQLPELESALQKLSTPLIAERINIMLEAGPPSLPEPATTRFMETFGEGGFVDGHYIAVRPETIRQTLNAPRCQRNGSSQRNGLTRVR